MLTSLIWNESHQLGHKVTVDGPSSSSTWQFNWKRNPTYPNVAEETLWKHLLFNVATDVRCSSTNTGWHLVNYDAGELAEVPGSRAATRRHTVLLEADGWQEESVRKNKTLNVEQDGFKNLCLPVWVCLLPSRQPTHQTEKYFWKLKNIRRSPPLPHFSE